MVEGAPDEFVLEVVHPKPVRAVVVAVTLAQIKADAKLAGMGLLKQSRLSVSPLSAAEFKRVLKLGNTKL